MKFIVSFCKVIFVHILLVLLVLSACSPKDSSQMEENVGVSPEPVIEKTEAVSTNEPTPVQSKSIIKPEGNTVETRFDVPEGFERMPVADGSFESYLRNLPLKPDGSYVQYYNGKIKYNGVYCGVIDMDIGERDLYGVSICNPLDTIILIILKNFFTQFSSSRSF